MLGTLRRRVAIGLCPELQVELNAVRSITIQAPAGHRPVCPDVQMVIRVGYIWLNHHDNESFVDAAGMSHWRAQRSTKGNWVEKPQAYHEAMRMQQHFRALQRRPPEKMRPKTRDVFLTFFSQHWPDDLPWPDDIPRPPKTAKKQERAA